MSSGSRAQACPLCTGQGVAPLFESGATQVVRCRGCGLQFASTYPDIEQTGSEMYGAEYFARAQREAEARRRIFSLLLDEVEAILAPAAHRAPGVESVSASPSDGQRDTAPPRAPRRFLDVGAGEGTLLQVAGARGWQAEGIDVAGEMVRHGREKLGLQVQHATLEQAKLDLGAFDCIVLNHVLEHVRDPVAALRRVAGLLRPGGVVRVEVPNLASLSSHLKNLQSRLGLKRQPWKHYSVEHHFWFFTPATLRKTFAGAGLEIVRLSTPARQWDAPTASRRLSHRVQQKWGWGKHIVAYGRRLAAFALLAATLGSAGVQSAAGAPGSDNDTPSGTPSAGTKAAYLVVLGIAQDGGVPQAGSLDSPGWHDPAAHRKVVCLGLVDPASSQRWMFEATPDFPVQLHALDTQAPTAARPGLDGIFLTHAHVGHYAGLIHLGHEVMGARGVPVYAMPRLLEFLRTNGPWEMLVRRSNIELRALQDSVAVALNPRLQVVPFRVPHRQEYSEAVGFRILGPERSVLFLPDIDRWEDLDAMGVRIEDLIRQVDVAYLDATFYADGEIPGRDMTGFPHPFITRSMERFATLPAAERAKIRFIHLNHTNPALDPSSEAHRRIAAGGYRVAAEMERIDL